MCVVNHTYFCIFCALFFPIEQYVNFKFNTDGFFFFFFKLMSKYVCVVMSVSWASHHLQNLYLFPGLSLSKTFQTLHCSWPLWPDFKVTVALGTPESHLFLYLLLNVFIQSNPNCLSDHRAHHILCLSYWLACNLLLGRRKKKVATNWTLPGDVLLLFSFIIFISDTKQNLLQTL